MARMELLVAAAVAMGASLALADGAVSRGSASGGGSSSSGSSGGSVSSSSSSSSSGGSSWSGGSSSSAGARSRAPGRSSATSATRAGRGSPATPAQARQPRPGPGYRGGHSGRPYYPGYTGHYYGSYPYGYFPGYGLYGNPWFGGIGWGWGSSYWSAPGWGYWGYYDPFFYGYYAPMRAGGGGGRARAATEAATVRLISDPEDAAVIVDDRQVGVVSDFDDISERLRLSPGSHEIIIRKPGYVTHRLSVYVEAGEDLKIRHFLDKGTGETMETIGTPPPKLDLRTTSAVEADPSRERQDAEPVSLEPATLTVAVDPEDASIYVNGRFEGTSDEVTELVLPPGTHTVEVVRPGFRSTEIQVALEAGKDKTIEVKLERP